MDALADTPEREAIRDAVKALCGRFGDDYWSERDQTGTFPVDFHQAVAAAGWLGIAMPEEYGGSGLGVTAAAILMQTLASSGGAFAAWPSLPIHILRPHPLLFPPPP